MSNKRIEQAEIEKYWEIFSSLSGGGKYLTGAQAASVLKNSQLRDDQLERIWDLADVDNDGNLDFEEFCVAMRIIFDLVNGEYSDVPPTLPDWLVPESKVHLVQATRALSDPSSQSFSSPALSTSSDDEGLKDGFDWYMPPSSLEKYSAIYTTHKTPHGDISFSSLTPLYESLDVPDTDLRSAWNLVNPASSEAIGKNAAVAFLHILNQRHEGFRIPRSVPASLRASFEEGRVDYNMESSNGEVRTKGGRGAGRYDDSSSTGRKAKFGDAYLERLGVGDRGVKGTDFSGVKKDGEWEEVRLKKEYRELESKIERVEKEAQKRRQRGGGGGRRDNKPALVKRELELLLDYKRKEIRDLETGEGKWKGADDLRRVDGEIQGVREMVEGLERHLREREGVLEGLRREIETEKQGR
ncbi:endocytosis defective- protein [Bacidia gigantensis]|uniref:endocytosis defective- protein n=1 Tax=Bacidia gigantensis TaxID=2732470 RepID=UPI001D054921|nr:endocytosis defective- protein [Bacidia gigantensis]KAG8528469.1 endocytosis defective- protein [Bacidia gigantensis]